jgi:PadR family transcriptional regulator PadR
MAVEPSLSHTAAMILQAIHAGRISGSGVMEVTGLPKGTVYPAMHRLERDDLTANSVDMIPVATI